MTNETIILDDRELAAISGGTSGVATVVGEAVGAAAGAAMGGGAGAVAGVFLGAALAGILSNAGVFQQGGGFNATSNLTAVEYGGY